MSDEMIDVIGQAVVDFNSKKYYECHEILESRWREEPDGVLRNFLQGFIHLAVSLHHRQGSNRNGESLQQYKGLRLWESVDLNNIGRKFGFDFDRLKKEMERQEQTAQVAVQIHSIALAESP